MTAYRGKAPTTKCARCEGKGYNFRMRDGDLVMLECHTCEGTGRHKEWPIKFTVASGEAGDAS